MRRLKTGAAVALALTLAAVPLSNAATGAATTTTPGRVSSAVDSGAIRVSYWENTGDKTGSGANLSWPSSEYKLVLRKVGETPGYRGMPETTFDQALAEAALQDKDTLAVFNGGFWSLGTIDNAWSRRELELGKTGLLIGSGDGALSYADYPDLDIDKIMTAQGPKGWNIGAFGRMVKDGKIDERIRQTLKGSDAVATSRNILVEYKDGTVELLQNYGHSSKGTGWSVDDIYARLERDLSKIKNAFMLDGGGSTRLAVKSSDGDIAFSGAVVDQRKTDHYLALVKKDAVTQGAVLDYRDPAKVADNKSESVTYRDYIKAVEAGLTTIHGTAYEIPLKAKPPLGTGISAPPTSGSMTTAPSSTTKPSSNASSEEAKTSSSSTSSSSSTTKTSASTSSSSETKTETSDSKPSSTTSSSSASPSTSTATESSSTPATSTPSSTRTGTEASSTASSSSETRTETSSSEGKSSTSSSGPTAQSTATTPSSTTVGGAADSIATSSSTATSSTATKSSSTASSAGETSTSTSTATSSSTTGSSSAGEASPASSTAQSSSSASKTEADTKTAAPDRKPAINTGSGLLAEAGPISAVLMGGLTGVIAALRLRKRK